MSEIGQYILSVIAAAMLCSILLRLVGKSGNPLPVLKLLCGIFMIYVVIAPWTNIHWDRYMWYSHDIELYAQDSVTAGSSAAEEAMSNVIKQTVESYISNKATTLNAQIDARIIMSHIDSRLPEYAQLTGNVSPYVKQRLTQYIAEEFGIPEDRQIWT